MLKIRTKIGKSTIAGIGLFAAEFIPKDTVIWELSPEFDRVFTEEEYQKMSPVDKDFTRIYSFKFMGKYYLCVDNARFFNHSDSPNCLDVEYDENNMGCTKALRDIEIGEELTSDYNCFGISEEDKEFNLDIFN